MTEKLKPTYDLESIQAAVKTMSMAGTALRGAAELGMVRKDIEAVILSLTRRDFYKSMTTYQNHRIWMDVYHGRAMIDWDGKPEQVEIYIKFVQDAVAEFTLTSFKEKQE